MKYLLPFFLFLSSTCFALPSKKVMSNLDIVWEAENNGNHQKSIALCTEWIEDPTIAYIDKLHYIVARSVFHLSDKNNIGYESDMVIIHNWMRHYPEVAHEFFTCYEGS